MCFGLEVSFRFDWLSISDYLVLYYALWLAGSLRSLCSSLVYSLHSPSIFHSPAVSNLSNTRSLTLHLSSSDPSAFNPNTSLT